MSKKITILTISAGVVLFAVSLGVGWFISQKTKPQTPETQAKTETDSKREPELIDTSEKATDEFSRNLSERELERLLVETKETLQEYKQKANKLEKRQARLNTTREMIEKDLAELDKLRFELSQASGDLKDRINRLKDLKIEINKSKRDNLVALASTYDSMDSASASDILANMTQLPGKNQEGISDAIKILYFMSDRKRAKLLEKLSENEPELAAVFCNRLKFITETN